VGLGTGRGGKPEIATTPEIPEARPEPEEDRSKRGEEFDEVAVVEIKGEINGFGSAAESECKFRATLLLIPLTNVEFGEATGKAEGCMEGIEYEEGDAAAAAEEACALCVMLAG
jgi:hypothetical protein